MVRIYFTTEECLIIFDSMEELFKRAPPELRSIILSIKEKVTQPPKKGDEL